MSRTFDDLGYYTLAGAAMSPRDLIQEAADVSPADVAIDMSAVTFIDARGLSLLLLTQNRLAERGLRCQFVSPSHAVRRLFNILGLESE